MARLEIMAREPDRAGETRSDGELFSGNVLADGGSVRFLTNAFSRRVMGVWLCLFLGISFPVSAVASTEVRSACNDYGGLIGTDSTLTMAGSPYCATTSINV